MQQKTNKDNNHDMEEDDDSDDSLDYDAHEKIYSAQLKQQQEAKLAKQQEAKEVHEDDIIELTEHQEDMFRKGMNVVFANWSVIRLIIENEACGHDTKEVVEDFRDRLASWLVDEGLLGLTPQDVQEYMSEVFAEDLGVDVEDGSVTEVAKMLLDMLTKCHLNDFVFIENLLKDQEEKEKAHAAYAAQKKQENAKLEQFLDKYVPAQDKKQAKKQQAKIAQMQNLMLSDDEDEKEDDNDQMEGASDDDEEKSGSGKAAKGWSTVQKKKK